MLYSHLVSEALLEVSDVTAQRQHPPLTLTPCMRARDWQKSGKLLPKIRSSFSRHNDVKKGVEEIVHNRKPLYAITRTPVIGRGPCVSPDEGPIFTPAFCAQQSSSLQPMSRRRKIRSLRVVRNARRESRHYHYTKNADGKGPFAIIALLANAPLLSLPG